MPRVTMMLWLVALAILAFYFYAYGPQ